MKIKHLKMECHADVDDGLYVELILDLNEEKLINALKKGAAEAEFQFLRNGDMRI
ncbi:MAG: hypothetical protein K6G83_09395 [Lachnospiraceae bacterium]|nr:hypothetical protein [Lachnospiraceae bacterium]